MRDFADTERTVRRAPARHSARLNTMEWLLLCVALVLTTITLVVALGGLDLARTIEGTAVPVCYPETR